MKLKDKEKWELYVKKNTDPYGSCCVRVAKRVMELLDEDPTPLHPGYFPDIHTAHGLIYTADEETEAGGLTGFMAGAVASMVYYCHERGKEFRKSYEDRIE